MATAVTRAPLNEALQGIEGGVLPTISMLLDTLLDAAALARPGVDASHYADQIRALGAETELLIRQFEGAVADPAQTPCVPAASVA